MKQILLLMVIIGLVAFSSPAAHAATATADFNISFIGQDPSPAIPGKYVDLTFRAKGGSAYAPSDVNFQIVEKFPFSLEPGAQKILNLGDIQSIGRATEKNDFLFKIRLLVDGKAADGDNELEYKYSIGSGVFSTKIQIPISKVRTDFDVIVQEIAGDSVSLGVVNTGKNDAKSVVVKVLESETFELTSIDSGILGNLASGDFTVTTFKLIPKTAERNSLNLLVSYTDAEGTRHDLSKSVSLQMNPADLQKTVEKKSRFSGSHLIIAFLVLVIIALAYLAFFRKK